MSEHEARFDIYCKKCKHRNLKENEDPCWDCLTEPVNQDSRRPVYFKEDKDANTNSSSDV